MKNRNYPVGNRTRDLPAFGAVPQHNSYQMERSAKVGSHQTYHRCFGEQWAHKCFQIFLHPLFALYTVAFFVCLCIYLYKLQL